MSIAAYDKIETNHQLLLSLPFREGVGTITRDVAKPGHLGIDLVGVPAWTSLASGLEVLDFNGATDYLECPAANTADLDFTTEDYSITAWLNWTAGVLSQIIIARYGLDLDGWETYLTEVGAIDYLQLRHHHAPDRDGCYSVGWAPGVWCLMGITRSGLYPKMYRNGLPVEVTYDVGGLADPTTCNRDLVIGTRYTKNTNWFEGQMWDPRIWLGELSPIQMRAYFNMTKHWFGVE